MSLCALAITLYCGVTYAAGDPGELENEPDHLAAAAVLDDEHLAVLRGKSVTKTDPRINSEIAVILWDESQNGSQSGKHSQMLGTGNVQSNSLTLRRP